MKFINHFFSTSHNKTHIEVLNFTSGDIFYDDSIHYYAQSYNLTNYLVIIIMGFIGSYSDSLMGAYLQGKFTCSKCY